MLTWCRRRKRFRIAVMYPVAIIGLQRDMKENKVDVCYARYSTSFVKFSCISK